MEKSLSIRTGAPLKFTSIRTGAPLLLTFSLVLGGHQLTLRNFRGHQFESSKYFTYRKTGDFQLSTFYQPFL